jgi:valyl-tRNA synthetase
MMDKRFEAALAEDRQSRRWDERGAFVADADSARPKFSMVMPPPNITGSLHIGHALNLTIQDVVARYKRKLGYDVLWLPGTDHASIATHLVIERQLREDGKTRFDIGREDFLRRAVAWKESAGDTIAKQIRRLGASADWSRQHFTMDRDLTYAVNYVFVTLYQRGLAYRGKRLVNWDPAFRTAISDLEVEQREVEGSIWYLRYPLADEAGRFVTVATTRPETMFGDTAVAVNPGDDRYRDLAGRHVLLPLANRRIPIVFDQHADPTKGSGAVKITPGHDFNDYEVGVRHNLPLLNILNADATLNDAVPEAFRGLDRYVARKAVVEALDAAGLLDRVEKTMISLPYGDRSNAVIEPWLTEQWFVDVANAAAMAIDAVESERTKFVPPNWANVFFQWMRGIQPWCVSRQLWYGHRIPAWYGPDGHVLVAMSEEDARRQARDHYGRESIELRQDEDIFDTWFSSALWPLATFGWPEPTKDLKRYYPTDLLVTGFDIIFFWVGRMMMQGLQFGGDVPFRTVYIHGLVRDQHGQKMSKTKGNVVDPLELIDRYGSDAARFSLMAACGLGQDIKFLPDRVEVYRNFATKLWNAARFAELNECGYDPAFDPAACKVELNRWIVGEFAAVVGRYEEALDAYRFNDAASTLYQFIWGTFCDWYVEFAKVPLTGGNADAGEVRRTIGWCIGTICHVLHPIMPFVTEELWEHLNGGSTLLATTAWPRMSGLARDERIAADFEWLIGLISAVRHVRFEMRVPPGSVVNILLKDPTPAIAARIKTHKALVKALARAGDVAPCDAAPACSAQVVVDGGTAVLPLAGIIDLKRERDRIEREMQRLDDEIGNLTKRLADNAFRTKAAAEAIEKIEDRRAKAVETRGRLRDALWSIAG